MTIGTVSDDSVHARLPIGTISGGSVFVRYQSNALDMIEQKLKWERIKAGIVPLYLPERNQYWYDVRTLTRYYQTMLYKIGVTCLYKGHNVMFCTLVVIT